MRSLDCARDDKSLNWVESWEWRVESVIKLRVEGGEWRVGRERRGSRCKAGMTSVMVNWYGRRLYWFYSCFSRGVKSIVSPLAVTDLWKTGISWNRMSGWKVACDNVGKSDAWMMATPFRRRDWSMAFAWEWVCPSIYACFASNTISLFSASSLSDAWGG